MSHYSAEHAQRYDAHHHKSWRTRLTTWRERQMLARMLGSLDAFASILDVPCGTGRFLPVLAASTATRVFAADNSAGMLARLRGAATSLGGRLQLINASVFELPLADNAVECIVSLRLFHHFALATDRARALAELHRVTSRHLLVSLWVDGNLQARRRAAKDAQGATVAFNVGGFGPRRCIARTRIEAEFAAAGFRVRSWRDVAPGLSMWRLYCLEKRPTILLERV